MIPFPLHFIICVACGWIVVCTLRELTDYLNRLNQHPSCHHPLRPIHYRQTFEKYALCLNYVPFLYLYSYARKDVSNPAR